MDCLKQWSKYWSQQKIVLASKDAGGQLASSDEKQHQAIGGGQPASQAIDGFEVLRMLLVTVMMVDMMMMTMAMLMLSMDDGGRWVLIGDG